MKNQIRCRQNQPFKAKLLATLSLFFAVAILLSSLTFAEEQKKEQKSSCPYMKATSGCCPAEKACAEKKDAKKECKSKQDSKSGESACESKPSADGKSCEKKKVSSNAQCSDCKCCSACNCTGQKHAKMACSCGDSCKCCASCCYNKA